MRVYTDYDFLSGRARLDRLAKSWSFPAEGLVQQISGFLESHTVFRIISAKAA